MPIEIYGDNTILEYFTKYNRFIPSRYNILAENDDPKEQFRSVTANQVLRLFGMLMTKEPFNPILGETLQGHFSGDAFYAEQVSHHPPISSCSIYGRKYTYHTNFNPVVSFAMNMNECVIA